MKKNILLIILFNTVIGTLLQGQSWKQYPCQPEKSLIRFPVDEGFHNREPVEWWYINAHAKGIVTGHEYSFMVTYFCITDYLPVGFRIFSICDETSGTFHSQTLPCNYQVLDTNKLGITAYFSGGTTEHFSNDTGSDGNIIPFDYMLDVSSDYGSLNIECSSQKPPLIINDSGFIYQGASGYSFYYSLTDIAVSGTITFEGLTEEITGLAWIDRQYGNFNPYDNEKYEWLSLQLDNNMELNIWNIFTAQHTIPDTPAYKICCISLDDSSGFSTSSFTMERVKYAFTPDNEVCYASAWFIKLDTLDIELVVAAKSSDHEIMIPFRFFEGSTRVEGSVNGTSVTGKGFAELLHAYDQPEIQISCPVEDEIWDTQKSLQWKVINPDDGNKLQFDIEISNDKGLSFNKIVENIKTTSFYWNPAFFYNDTSLLVRLTAYSYDSTLNTQILQDMKIVQPILEYKACAGEQMVFDVSLHNPESVFQWLKNGIPLSGETDSILVLNNLQPSSSGAYSCAVKGYPFSDTTLAYLLSVGDRYCYYDSTTICDGEEFMGHPVTLPGPLTVDDSLQTIHGCDSIIRYHITVEPCTPNENIMTFTGPVLFHDSHRHKLVIRFHDNFTGKLLIFDLYGRCIRTEKLSAVKNHEIALQKIKSGIFFIRFSGTINTVYKFSVLN